MSKALGRKDFINLVVTLIDEHRLAELQHLIQDKAQPLPETAVRMGYRRYLEQDMALRTRFFLIRKLREITGIEPEDIVSQGLIRSMIGVQPVPVFKLVFAGLDIRPGILKAVQREIQDWYRSLLENSQYLQLGQLQEITRLAPDPALVQDMYKNYLMSGKLISFTGMNKQLGIAPLESMVQQVYTHYRQVLAASSTPVADRENIQKWYDKLQSLTGFADASPRQNGG